jgi:hypothetical protein
VYGRDEKKIEERHDPIRKKDESHGEIENNHRLLK